MAKKKKFYVVWIGLNPGVYDNWTDCKRQTSNFPGAKYKSFKSKEEADDAYANGYQTYISTAISLKGERPRGPKKKADYFDFLDEIEFPSMSVDAACSGNPGKMEYQGVDTLTKEVFFRIGPFKSGTNNIGEFLALIHGLALLQKKKDEKTPIYSDSRTALSWWRKKKVKTTFFQKHTNDKLKKLLDRATDWMSKNQPKNPVLKWNTEKWGEIPADFGRK